jgi:type IV pilus assembly protein PilC
MSNYVYVAVDPRGVEKRGLLEVADQSEALRRIKEMGLFPTRVLEEKRRALTAVRAPGPAVRRWKSSRRLLQLGGRVKAARLAVFTRQLATLIQAGMPLLRGLRTLEEQEENHTLKRVTAGLCSDIEGGSSLAEAMAAHPRVFNSLYLNMVRAGEIGGALDTTLTRLAEFMEKGQKIKGKVKAALFYPAAVLVVAFAIMALLMMFVVPRFKQVFAGLLNGAPLPAFTQVVFKVSDTMIHNAPWVAIAAVLIVAAVAAVLRTKWGRWTLDRAKLAVPVLGPLFRKASISRFSRTLGTLVSNGVPILQAMTIVRETAGNQAIGRLIARIHENVKQGDNIAPTLKSSSLFPAMVAGMVDVGEQTGSLPEMLMKVADTYDDQVDNAATAMTSLLEPIMIVFLAIIVGSIVMAVFCPLIQFMTGFENPDGGHGGEI